MRFPQILKELRQERGTTQKDLANAIGYTQANISRWEKGEQEPTSGAITAICAFYEVSADFLLGLSNDWGNITLDTNYSFDEQKIIALYRTMDKELQENALSTMELFARSANSTQKKFK